MLIEKIDEDFRQAIKARDTLKVETIRMLKSALRNFLIEKRKEQADDQELITLIQKQIKMRQDAIEGFKKGGRQDLVDKETQEKAILENYLPPALSDTDLEGLVKKIIADLGAKTRQDVGKVMKEALIQAAGRADGRRVNEVLGKLLS